MLALLALWIGGCGGGGGGSGGGGAAMLPVTPASADPPAETRVAAPTLVSDVAAAGYAPGSEEAAAYALLDAERNRCGFGRLAQDAALDRAAQGHAAWQIRNGTFSHEQLPGTPGFTGTTPGDRAGAAGYVGAIGDEIAGWTGSSRIAGTGQAGVRALLALPYHQAGLMAGFREVGIAIAGSDSPGFEGIDGPPRRVVQLNLGYRADAGPQLPSGDAVLTYPCAGTSGAQPEITDETPNPVPGRDLRSAPLGASVLVASRVGSSLVVSSARMTSTANGSAVRLRVPMDAANDPNGVLQSHQAVLIPDLPLAPGTSYQVQLEGTRDGVRFARSFAFTTGASSLR